MKGGFGSGRRYLDQWLMLRGVYVSVEEREEKEFISGLPAY